MRRIYVFADESGNFDFSRQHGATKYFILCTLTAGDCRLGDELLKLRRELAWRGVGLNTEFHATTDTQAIRDEVFKVLQQHQFRVDATILEKAKAKPSIRPTDERFYQMAWYLHMKYLAPRVVRERDELLVIGASVGTRKRRVGFHAAVTDVIQQVSPTTSFQVASWAGTSDPCLQAVDYCAWALQRKWEGNDDRSYRLIASKVRSEFEVFRRGTTRHY
jgi:hypothetical protein